MSGRNPQANLDNHSNQCNPNNPRYQGYESTYSGTGTRPDLNNHGNQLNPNNPVYQAPQSTQSGQMPRK